MKDKEKQIEEMASDMDYACTKRDLYPSDAKEIAKALYLLGYRKITDNVVLSKEEYENSFDIKVYNKVREENRLLKKKNDKLLNELIKERKETAEKIFSELMSNISEIRYDAVCDRVVYIEDIIKVAKQFGVEIKE